MLWVEPPVGVRVVAVVGGIILLLSGILSVMVRRREWGDPDVTMDQVAESPVETEVPGVSAVVEEAADDSDGAGSGAGASSAAVAVADRVVVPRDLRGARGGIPGVGRRENSAADRGDTRFCRGGEKRAL